MHNGVNKINIISTRYAGLGIANTNPAGVALWRFIDKHEAGMESAVGEAFPTKEQILLALDGYAESVWGYRPVRSAGEIQKLNGTWSTLERAIQSMLVAQPDKLSEAAATVEIARKEHGDFIREMTMSALQANR